MVDPSESLSTPHLSDRMLLESLLLQELHHLWPPGAEKLANTCSLKVCLLGPR